MGDGGYAKRMAMGYGSWQGAKTRVSNPNQPRWPDYGGRGIDMDPRWFASFDAFLADMGPRPPGMTLDRIDNDRGYWPGNARWATPKEQRANRRDVLHRDLSGRFARPLAIF